MDEVNDESASNISADMLAVDTMALLHLLILCVIASLPDKFIVVLQGCDTLTFTKMFVGVYKRAAQVNNNV